MRGDGRISERIHQRDMSHVTARQVRACDGKARYPSKRNAVGKAAVVERWQGRRMNAYRCSLCSAWHIGHTSSRTR